MVTGTCLCGAIARNVTGRIDLINHCHCTMCRRVHGSAFGAFAHAHARDFRWRRGESTIASYESSPGFVGSKAPWYDITDDLPQFDAFPPDDQW